MDFNEAIFCHIDWKRKLAQYLSRPDQSLKASEVEADNNCELGKWIYGEGAKYSGLPEYEELKREHAKLHQCAAAIITQADSGKAMVDEVWIGSGSEFALTSSKVIGTIMAIKAKTVHTR